MSKMELMYKLHSHLPVLCTEGGQRTGW